MFTALGSFFNRISDPEMGRLRTISCTLTSLFILYIEFGEMAVFSHLRMTITGRPSSFFAALEPQLRMHLMSAGGTYLTLLNTLANMGELDSVHSRISI